MTIIQYLDNLRDNNLPLPKIDIWYKHVVEPKGVKIIDWGEGWILGDYYGKQTFFNLAQADYIMLHPQL